MLILAKKDINVAILNKFTHLKEMMVIMRDVRDHQNGNLKKMKILELKIQ